MTTIAADSRSVCSDSLRVMGSEIVDSSTAKIVGKGGRVFAFTGTFGLLMPAVDWFLDGADPAKFPNLGKDNEGRLLVFEAQWVTSYSTSLPYGEAFAYPQAFGSGAAYALGAMHAGKTAREAIEIASKLCVFTGGPIQELAIPQEKREAAE